ncbi:hypothetical protein ACFQX6_48095 [Streptosporangium lutulentum]
MSESSALPLYMRRAEFGPDPELEALRDGEGVRRVSTPLGIDAWLVTRHEDVRTVMGDAERFSTAWKGGIRLPGALEMSEKERAELRAGNLLAFDPPEHTRLRRMLTPEFTIRRMRGWSRGSSASSRNTWTRWNAPGPRPTWCRRSRCRSRRW